MRKPRPLHPLVLFSAICLCACSGASSEPSSLPDSAPAIIALLPDANESTVFLTDPITATYDAAMAPADAASFAVHGGFTGTLAGTYAGGGTTTLSFTPSNGFIAGEEIEVTLTDGLSSSAGSAAAPFVYRFRAEVLSGSGSFSGVADVAGQTDVRGVAAGDWDADGNLDLAAANFGASSVAILQNNGNGSFAALQTIPGLQGATALAAGDWNADSRRRRLERRRQPRPGRRQLQLQLRRHPAKQRQRCLCRRPNPCRPARRARTGRRRLGRRRQPGFNLRKQRQQQRWGIAESAMTGLKNNRFLA